MKKSQLVVVLTLIFHYQFQISSTNAISIHLVFRTIIGIVETLVFRSPESSFNLIITKTINR